MIRLLRILALRWRCWWARIAVEIDEAAIYSHQRTIERNRSILAHLESKLDQLEQKQKVSAMKKARAA